MTRFREILRILATHKVDFIVVGGISAVLNGAPVNTLDLDIVHSPESENIARLLQALGELDAEYRDPGGRKLRSAERPLKTRFGPLDVLGSVGRDMGYGDLLPHASEMTVADNLTVRVLDLPTLIEIKEYLGTEKDRAVLPTLKRTLQERRR